MFSRQIGPKGAFPSDFESKIWVENLSRKFESKIWVENSSRKFIDCLSRFDFRSLISGVWFHWNYFRVLHGMGLIFLKFYSRCLLSMLTLESVDSPSFVFEVWFSKSAAVCMVCLIKPCDKPNFFLVNNRQATSSSRDSTTAGIPPVLALVYHRLCHWYRIAPLNFLFWIPRTVRMFAFCRTLSSLFPLINWVLSFWSFWLISRLIEPHWCVAFQGFWPLWKHSDKMELFSEFFTFSSVLEVNFRKCLAAATFAKQTRNS